LIFCRYTHIGLLRLLTNRSAMEEQTLTIRKAWTVYDRWIEDPRVEFHAEPSGIEVVFRHTTGPFGTQPASKWVGDCYLLAYAKHIRASLVAFDTALYAFAHQHGHAAVMPT
jgi:predicted nucleic acid-binding protein